MGFLSFAHDGRVIAAGLTVGSIALLAGIRLMLEYIRDQNEVRTPQPKPRYITQETEDSLKLNTLESLLGHYNFAIRETAAKIICDRALNEPESVDYLLWGITRPDYDERMKSLRTLALITDQNSLHILHTDRAYSALVRSLELSVDESPCRKLDDKYYDDYYLRDMSEKFCLMFIIQLLNKYDDPERLVRAKFIEKWLVTQPWGDSAEERQRNFSQYLSHRQNRIRDISMRIRETRGGYQALQKAGLLSAEGGPSPESEEDADDINGIRIVLSITGEGAVRAVETYQPRVLEQSAEEQRLRRQHREAMVLNDGTRPLGRGDIIERDHD